MTTYLENKKCERCATPLPDHYRNLLCNEHYLAFVEEERARKAEIEKQQVEEILKNPGNPTHPEKVESFEPALEKAEAVESSAATPVQAQVTCTHADCGIEDPNYTENPEAEDKNQVLANLAQFVYTHREKDHPKGRKHGILLYYPQRNMYTFVRNYCMKKAMSHPQYPKHIWKAKIVDIGCGSGVGANIMSQEADVVWGIDKNEFSIEFAREAFTRTKNGEYYSGQLTFDVIDLMHENRTLATFDIVTAIEIIEHVWDVNGFLNSIKRFAKRDKKGQIMREQATEYFISTPNRNNAKIRKDRPENLFHVREWTAQEFKKLLLRHFEHVELMNDKGEPVADDAVDQVIFAKCSIAL